MNANTQAALMWLDHGVSPIPVIPKSKKPAVDWKVWQDRLPPRKVVDYWFKDPMTNVGVICGGPSNLTIIDFDNQDYYTKWYGEVSGRNDKWGSIANDTYMVKTPRGMHVYVLTNDKEQSRKYPDKMVDVRCQGNYTLVPPSIHPSGNAYLPIGTPDQILKVDTISDMFPEPEMVLVSSKSDKTIFNYAQSNHVAKDIKSNVSILSFIGQMTQLRRTSVDGRWWMGRCIHPNHDDKSPSMRVDALRGRVKCLSCSCKLYHDIGYDVIDVYAILNNISVSQAIREMEMIYL